MCALVQTKTYPISLYFPTPDVYFLKGSVVVWIQGARVLLFRIGNCKTTVQNTEARPILRRQA